MKAYFQNFTYSNFINILGWIFYVLGLLRFILHFINSEPVPPYLFAVFFLVLSGILFAFSPLIDLYSRVKKLEAAVDQEAK